METEVFNTCRSAVRIYEEPRISYKKEIWGPPGREWEFNRPTRHMQFTLKYKGTTYHDGVKVTDWILYKKGNEMNEVLSREVTGTPAAQEATSVDNAGNVQADANTPVKVEVKHVQDEEAVGGKAVESVVL